MFTFVLEMGMKAVFRIKDDTDLLGNCVIPLDSMAVFAESPPQWYDLGSTGKINIQIGWYGGYSDRRIGTELVPVFKFKKPKGLSFMNKEGQGTTPGTTPTRAASNRVGADGSAMISRPSVSKLRQKTPQTTDLEGRVRTSSVTAKKKERPSTDFRIGLLKKTKSPKKKDKHHSGEPMDLENDPSLKAAPRILIDMFVDSEEQSTVYRSMQSERSEDTIGSLRSSFVETSRVETLKDKLRIAEEKLLLEKEVRLETESMLDKFSQRITETSYLQDKLTLEIKMKDLHLEQKDIQINNLKDQLEATQKRISVLEDLARKYQKWDPEAREVLGQSIKVDDIQNQQLAKKIEETEGNDKEVRISNNPIGYATFLMNNETLENLAAVREKLGSVDAVWRKLFIMEGGLNGILVCFQRVESMKNPELKLIIREVQLVHILKCLFQKQTLIHYIIRDHNEIMRQILEVSMLSVHTMMKVQMLMFLSGLCLYSKIAQKFVSSSLMFTAKHPKPFFVVFKTLQEETDIQLTEATICFLNSLIVGEKELGARMELRNIFLENDILSTLNKKLQKYNTKNCKIEIQVQRFKEIHEDDENRLITLRYVGNVDLHSIGSVFDKLVMQTEALKCQSVLLSIFQHFLLIPQIAQNPASAFKFIQAATRRVTYVDEAKSISRLTLEELHESVSLMFKKEQLRQEISNTENSDLTMDDLDEFLGETSAKPIISNTAPIAPPFVQSDISAEVVPPPTKDVRKLFWQKIPDQQVGEYWNDVQPEMSQIETIFPELEEKFPTKKAQVPTTTKTKKPQKLAILPVHIANNISILRAQFRTLSDEQIYNRLIELDKAQFTVSQLEALCKCVESAEVKSVCEY